MASTPTIKQRNAIHAANIHRRGNVKDTLKPPIEKKVPVNSTTLAVLMFVVFGGAVFELLRWIV